MKKIETQKGITLIALVITIIILIILAGISISMLVGENGLITKSKEAKQNTQLAEGQENKELANLTEYLNGELDGNGGASNLPDDTTKPELQSLKLRINTGDTGIMEFIISEKDYSTDTVIDWGDGTVQNYDDIEIIMANRKNKQIQLASIAPIGNLQLALALPRLRHTYTQSNKEYIITITGTWKQLEFMDSEDNLLEVLQWGTTGLENINLTNCSSLKKIAQPSKNSFINMTDFSYSFASCSELSAIPENLFANCPNVTSFSDTFSYCHAITTIPENLFANCPNVMDFSGIFRGCSNLTSIPKNLFANCLKVESFKTTFANCYKLSGDPIALWERVPNGATNGYQGVPDGSRCYTNSTGLNNYNSIPEYWRNPFPS